MDKEKEDEVMDFIGRWCAPGNFSSAIVEGTIADLLFNGSYVIIVDDTGMGRYSPEDFYNRFRGKIREVQPRKNALEQYLYFHGAW